MTDTEEFARQLHKHLLPGRVMSLDEVAAVMNGSGRYRDHFCARDIQEIEAKALRKLRIRLGRLLK